MGKSRKLALMSLLTAVALALNIAENFIPMPFLAPGAKLGLANIVTMIALVTLGYKDTLLIVITRIVLGSIYGGGMSGFMYSFTGGMFSLLSMALLVYLARDRVSMIGVSVTGAFFHSFGQVLMAAWIVQNIRLLSYLPILLSVSVGAGIFVGMSSRFAVRFVRRHYHLLQNPALAGIE